VGKTNKTWTVLVSFIAQIIFLIIAVILPMIYFDVLPKTQLTSFLVAPPPPPPPPPPPAAAAPVKIVKVIPRQFDAGRLMAPKSVPKEIARLGKKSFRLLRAAWAAWWAASRRRGRRYPGGVLGGIIGSVPTAVLPPPPPPPGEGSHSASASGSAATCSRPSWSASRKPVYPPLAKQARIQGVVHLAPSFPRTAPFRI
jgi:protein TonB